MQLASTPALGAARVKVASGTTTPDGSSASRAAPLADEELAVARRRMDAALIAAELGTFEWDIVADRLYGDANFERLFNIPLGDDGAAPLATFIDAIHPDDRKHTLAEVQRTVETGAPYESEYRIITGGQTRWVHARGKIERDPTGRPVRFPGAVLDITARKQAVEERQQVSNELRRLATVHETILSATDDFAYVFDTSGRFLYANRRLLEVWAKTLDDVVGRTCLELGYPAWHAAMHMREIEQVIATKQPIRGEVPFTGDSGISGVYDYIFTPVLDAAGNVEVIAGTTRDVTRRKQSEQRDKFLIALDDATRPLTDPQEITRICARLLGEFLAVNRCAYADVQEDEDTFNLTGDHNHEVPSIVGRYRFTQFSEACREAMRAGEPFVVEDAETDPRLGRVRDSFRATQIRAVICISLRKAGRVIAAMAVHQTSPRPWRSGEIELVQLVASRCWESIERIRVARVLAESEERLRFATQTGRLGVWELDWQTQELTCSATFKTHHGRPPEAPFNIRDVRDCVHPEDRERVDRAIAAAVADRVDYDMDYRVQWPDGSIHWVLVRGQASYDNASGSLRLAGVSLDITERKLVEERQRRLAEDVRVSTAKFKAFFDQSYFYAAILDLDGTIIDVNRTAVDACGYRREDVINRPFWKTGWWRGSARAQDRIREACTIAARGDPFQAELTYWLADRTERLADVTVRPVFDATGAIVYLSATGVDITTRKQGEEELKRARDQALAASRAKDDFLAALSHELRTPLNPVLLIASDAANDSALSAEVSTAFATIRRNVELEARLIDDLLDLTSITRGKLQIRKTALDVHAIVQDAVAAVRTELEAKRMAVALTLHATRTTVDADGVRLLQVFSNLLRNAIKFSPKGRNVTVSSRLAGEALEVSIADHGIGLTTEEISRVFDAFVQGDHVSSGAHRYGGLGVGLAIAQQLVEAHGGRIHAMSPGRDQGSTFVVRLPLATAPGAQVEPRAVNAADSTAPRTGKRILLVEDHEPTRQALERLLTRRHHTVVTADCIAAARERVGEQAVDLVISDLGLPDGNGADLMAELRQQYGLTGIALTGYGMQEDIARCLAAGFATHLTKPIRVESMEAALAAVG